MLIFEITKTNTPLLQKGLSPLFWYVRNPHIRTQPRQRLVLWNKANLIIISDAVYTGCGTARQIPDSKLLPRSIYDVLTHISNDFQRSLCRVLCRQILAVVARRPVYTRCKPSFVPQTFSAISIFLSSLGSAVMCTERSLLASWVDTPLIADWLQVCFGTGPDSVF